MTYRPTRLIPTLVLSLAVVGSSPRAMQQRAGPAGSTDETGVRTAVMKRIEGDRTRNAHMSIEAFADDAVWINAFGRRLVGRLAIENFLTALYADPGYVQRDEIQPPAIAEIVFVRDDVAIARVFRRNRGQRLPNGTIIPERRTHNTMTLTRERGVWQVRYEIVTDERDSRP